MIPNCKILPMELLFLKVLVIYFDRLQFDLKLLCSLILNTDRVRINAWDLMNPSAAQYDYSSPRQ